MLSKLLSVTADQLDETEYGKFYGTYIDHCRGRSIEKQLRDGRDQLLKLMEPLSEEQSTFRYEEGKWSIRQVIGHITDTERIMAYRALSFSRGEMAAIPGYDHNRYVEEANFDERTAADLISDYKTARQSTISLFHSFTDDMLMRRGRASDTDFTVRALGFIICGHELHHIKILKDRYLSQLD